MIRSVLIVGNIIKRRDDITAFSSPKIEMSCNKTIHMNRNLEKIILF